MSFERADELPAVELPEIERVIGRTGHGAVAVREDRHRGYEALVSLKGADELPAVEVPKFEGGVGGSGQGALTVRQHRHGTY